MLVKVIKQHDGYSNMVRRRGLRKVARESGISPGNLSRYVNNKKVCTRETLNKIRIACNKIALEETGEPQNSEFYKLSTT